MSRIPPILAALALILCAGIGSSAEARGDEETAFSAVARGREVAPVSAATLEWDPIEPVNRVFFAFNDGLDIVLIKPLAQGWYFVLRDPGTRAVDRFFTNLQFPVRFVGNLLQLHPIQTAEETARFLVNTTVGLAGFFDPASCIGLGLYEEDIGQVFGYWGIPPGPYLVLPLLGSSGARDFVGGLADGALLVGAISAANSTIGALNTRAMLLDEIAEAKRASLDYYAFVRNAYVTTRQALVDDRDPDAILDPLDEDLYDDDLYEIDEDDE